MTISTLLLFGPSPTVADEALRDPTRPYTARPQATGTSASFSVSAIFISPHRRIAIVNGVRVAEGEPVSGATVAEIRRDQVGLIVDGKKITARLRPGKAKEQ